MIINTGQRTDIPAFYSKWFINRIREGFVLVRNPFYPKLITKFILDPKVVDVISFCTKNPSPMFKYLDELNRFGQFWYVTITGFDNDLEPNTPSFNKRIENFKYLASKVGKNSCGVRYTPIIVNSKYTKEYHIKTFEYLVKELSNYTNLFVFGFIDLYDKLIKNHPQLKDCDDNTKIEIATKFKEIADKYNVDLRLCSKEKWLSKYNINVNGCMLISDYEKAINKNLIAKSKMNARKSYCSCFLSNDIGAYNSCMHLCLYCYANGKYETIINNFNKHNPSSPLLIGNIEDGDQIKLAKQESWIDNRNKLL